METKIIINRIWAMPNKNTFQVKPIGDFVRKYLSANAISLDPFAKNSKLATYTNDLNPETDATYHLTAFDFIKEMEAQHAVPGVVIFDPPYSLQQAKISYQDIGRGFSQYDAWYVGRWTDEKTVLARIMPIGSIFLHFGWHTNGMGKKHGFEIEEILIVAHGGAHNDTICMAERRIGD